VTPVGTEEILEEQNVDRPDSPDEVEAVDDMEVEHAEDDDFFGFTQDESASEPGLGVCRETPAAELDRYLTRVNRSWSLAKCFGKAAEAGGRREFPRLGELFLKFNTSLPSSASVERFFSLAGLSFTNLRNCLGDTTLEKEGLLCMNKEYWASAPGKM